MGGLRGGARLGMLAAVLALAASGTASASQVGLYTGGSPTFLYTADPGEANALKLTSVELGTLTLLVLVEDPGANIRAAGGCIGLGSTFAACVTPGLTLSHSSIDLGDRDDQFNGNLGLRIDGGPGDDVLVASRTAPDPGRYVAGGPFLVGGPGDDHLVGTGHADFLFGGDGNDDLRGGGGFDLADYGRVEAGSPRSSLTVTIDELANDGAPGEADNLHGDIEEVRGITHGPNHLTGSANADELTGGNVADVISGGGGDDFLRGGAGSDDLDGGAGRDRVWGEGDNDTLRVRDGEADEADCGDENDNVFADPIDSIADCELLQP